MKKKETVQYVEDKLMAALICDEGVKDIHSTCMDVMLQLENEGVLKSCLDDKIEFVGNGDGTITVKSLE